MKTARLVSVGLLLAVSTLTTQALAQSTDGFALNRFDPSERGSDWFSTESLDLRGHNRSAFGLVGDWSYKPLVLYDADDNEIAAIVEHQLFAHLGFSHILWNRLRLGASLPVALLVSGEDGNQENASFSTEDATTVGDLRLGGDVRLIGEYGGAFTSAFGVHVHLPTGSQDSFTGDGKTRIVPRLTAAGNIADFAYSARLGVNIRTQNENFADEPFGTEMLFGGAVGMRLMDAKLLVGPEVFGSTVMSDSGDGFFKRKTSPFEVIFGGHYRIDNQWQVGAGMGPGLTRGFGAPKVRVLASVEWFPVFEEEKPPPPDTDGDGILDSEDACPTVAGVANDDPKKHGCPPPSDRDGDGIVDEEDACPDEPGVKTDAPETNGCPPPKDRDGDGILDEQDACPDEPGVKTDDPKTNGCPPPADRDGDGILDEDDACPDQVGVADPDPKKHGCPKAKIVGKQIKILERVEFDTNKATIRPESEAVLNAVLDILKKHSEITKVSVEGHTDNRGGARHNMGLSRRRAASVMDWLTSRGVEASRLTSKGWGQTKPIDTNDTAEGRQNNRRVEFHILGRTETEGSK